MHADLREDKKKHRRWKVAENKVGCISLNPANENMFATAHLNRDVRIWDARKLMKIESTKSDYYTTYQKACVASYEHGKAVTSAYFDPSGRHLVTTCYDDKIRGELALVPLGPWTTLIVIPRLSLGYEPKSARSR